jgi:acetoacetate decarboxylase
MSVSVNPANAPLYPLPPWTHVGVVTLQVFCRTQERDAIRRWLPADVEPQGDGLLAINFVHIPKVLELGEHSQSFETGILVPVVHRPTSRAGCMFAVMFVDNDIALAAGRELWGHPKKFGDVRLSVLDGVAAASVKHPPYRDGLGGLIYEVEANLDGSNQEVSALAEQFGTRFLRRIIPDPFTPRAESDQLVRVIVSGFVSRRETTGSARVMVADGVDSAIALGRIEVLGAHLRTSDFVLRHAKPMADQRPTRT